MALEECGALIAAAALSYDPADTTVKRRAAETLAGELQISDATLAESRRRLADFRRSKARIPMSGVVLAGGASRRMGTSKAELTLKGKTLLDRQVDKLRVLGIRDILLSRKNCRSIPGTRVVVDESHGSAPM